MQTCNRYKNIKQLEQHKSVEIFSDIYNDIWKGILSETLKVEQITIQMSEVIFVRLFLF